MIAESIAAMILMIDMVEIIAETVGDDDESLAFGLDCPLFELDSDRSLSLTAGAWFSIVLTDSDSSD